MSLDNFINNNRTCPVCGEPLSLYLQIEDGTLWKGTSDVRGNISFNQFKCKSQKLDPTDNMQLVNENGSYALNFSTQKIFDKIHQEQLFFFYLCNEQAIEERSSYDYSINPYLACYYATTPIMSFSFEGLQCMLDTPGELVNNEFRDEICIFKTSSSEGLEKVYVLDLDYEFKKTVLAYYVTTTEERKNENFEPKMFKKELPLLSSRPNFSEKEKLISRLDSWIIMS